MPFPALPCSPERLSKIRKSMARIKTVLGERERAMADAQLIADARATAAILPDTPAPEVLVALENGEAGALQDSQEQEEERLPWYVELRHAVWRSLFSPLILAVLF